MQPEQSLEPVGLTLRKRLDSRSLVNLTSLCIGLISGFLVIPTFSLTLGTPLFYVNRGLEIPIATLVLTLALIIIWLSLFVLLYVVFFVFAKIISQKLLTTLVIFVGSSYFSFCAIYLNNLLAALPKVERLILVAILSMLVGFVSTKLLAHRSLGTYLLSALLIALIAQGLFNGNESAVKLPWKSKVQYQPIDGSPSVLFIVADETSYWAMLDEKGLIRSGLPNLQKLQGNSTTFLNAYAATANTDFSVPAILNGVGDVISKSEIYEAEKNSLFGFFPDSDSGFDRFFSSEIFDTPCSPSNTDCQGHSAQYRYINYLLDFTAVVGKNNLVGLRQFFPSISGKTKNYWDQSRAVDEFENLKEFYKTSSESLKPKFAFLHTLRTHSPWNRDAVGNVIWTTDHSEVGNFNNRELIAIKKQLYFSAIKSFDTELGQVLDLMKDLNQYDNTIVVLTADHGFASNAEQSLGEISGDGGRQGKTVYQLWNEIAHVPLLIKFPNQRESSFVDGLRSLGSIASTVVGYLDGRWIDGSMPMHDLNTGSSKDLIFYDTTSGLDPKLSVGFPDELEFSDPWISADFPGADIATSIGMSESLIGSKIPKNYKRVPFVLERFGLSSSPFELVSVVAEHCPHENSPALLVADDRITSSVIFENPKPNRASLVGWSISTAREDLEMWCPER
jgi:glucan phosphoethanolaminetransferase (alkaline phosphatase superfamily)